MVYRINILQTIAKNLTSMLHNFFKGGDVHVRISKKGRLLLNDKQAASKAVDAIMHGKKNLERGETIAVDGEDIQLELTTSVKSHTYK